MRLVFVGPLLAVLLLAGCTANNTNNATKTAVPSAAASVSAATRSAQAVAAPSAAPSASPTAAATPALHTADPIGNGCPVDFPVKVDQAKHSFGTDHPDYATVVPTICYVSAPAAVSAGFAAAALPSPPTVAATQPPRPAPTQPAIVATQPPPAPVRAAVPAQAPAPPVNPSGGTPQCPHGFIPSPGNGRGPTLCADGLCSHSAGRGTCSGHGGEALLIAPPVDRVLRAA